MREVVINVRCDVCQEEILEQEEGRSTVRLVVYGKDFEMDLCDECIGGSFLKEARPVTSKRKKARAKDEGGFDCADCGNRYTTARELSRHWNQAHLW